MLDFYIESGFRLRRFLQCPVGEHMNGFADWLHSAGYQRRPAQLALRGAAHLGYWASARNIATGLLNEQLGAFVCHVPTCTCSHDFRGHDDYHVTGARRFVEYLQTVEVLPRNDVEPNPITPLVKGFCDWMRQQRGVAESTLANYKPLVEEFIVALGDDAAIYDAAAVRAFIFARASRHGCGRAKSVVNAVRMFLRFLAASGDCSPKLIAAVPRIAHWKLSSLPRYISADWLQGRLRVVGKGRRETRLPLPQAPGDAVLHYLEHFRPEIDDNHVFLRVHAPLGSLPSSGPISKLVRRAVQRAGIETPSLGAHMLRHSAATEWLRQGASLDLIGAVLRHRSIESTAHYAKVDVAMLRSVAQPWPDKGGSPC